MANSTHRVTAGLVFLGTRSFDIVRIGNRISMVLDWLGEQTTGLRVLSDCAAHLHSDHFVLRIEIHQEYKLTALDQPAEHFLALSLSHTDPEASPQTQLALSILAHVLRALHSTLAPDYVQWIHPLALLSHAEFLEAITFQDEHEAPAPQAEIVPLPTATAARCRLPDIDTTHQALHARFVSESDAMPGDRMTGALRAVFRDNLEPADAAAFQSDNIRESTAPLRLSVWLMTITLGLFALPVAAALAIINLMRGENLRLASQTAAMTGLFLTLQVHGATAQALQTVQDLLG
ncbi:hypothetical protein rosmuc_03488 [Roseovarius mucosus DSM 17069]|uniref:Uncharacterized protein n=1 Tax=Roseovarius mucosus DSM 17069 TaxID=1288298 RepID=A0A0A0HJ40_9RHOB|nr:hypothetical protein [Roseovarius mucosus]KGM87185.1 hypothetical protein rosmuc_03488 [Roseovarius mucosus DSM 17069]